MATSTAYRVAMVTEPPVYLDLQASVDKACAIIKEAAENGAKLVTFGESWLPGYPFWVWLRGVPESLPLTARLFENSLEIKSKETAQICRAARDNNVHVIMGINERQGGSLYNSLLFIDEKGNIPLVRRKIKPTGAERMVWGQGDGNCLTVVKTDSVGTLGGQICWEHTMPGLDAAFCAQGEQVHLAAWPSFCLDLDYSLGLEANSALARAYAIRTQSFVVNVATVIQQDVIDLICVNERDHQLLRTGGGYAQLFAPNGASLNVSPGEHEATITYAEINLNLITFAKMICDSAGHYSRPDLIQVSVNQAKQEPVHFVDLEMGDKDELVDKSKDKDTKKEAIEQ
ncbi:MAG TPA: carbon-nitrogen hydrolase family protein [Bacilli bacterium]|nr:carbon-nitrogen hydrolase family protein [Bacilli bacterium]